MNMKSHWRRLKLIGLMLLGTIGIAAQTEWSFVALTSGGNIVSIDKNFIRSASGVTRVWQKTVLPNDDYTLNLFEWNCAKKSFRIIQTAMYDANGIIERSDKRTTWRSFVPDSTGMLLYSNICEADDRKDRRGDGESKKKTSSFARIIVKRADLMSEASSASKVIRRIALNEKLILVSDESVGVWYQVIDAKTNSHGWLDGNNFKIVRAKKWLNSAKKRTRRR